MVSVIGSVESLVPASALWLGLVTYTSFGPSLDAILAIVNLVLSLLSLALGIAMPAGGETAAATQTAALPNLF